MSKSVLSKLDHKKDAREDMRYLARISTLLWRTYAPSCLMMRRLVLGGRGTGTRPQLPWWIPPLRSEPPQPNGLSAQTVTKNINLLKQMWVGA